MSDLVTSIDDITKNLEIMWSYRNGASAEQKFCRERIKKGRLFVALKSSDGYLFAPSKFAGYKNNDARHADLLDKRDGRKTNAHLTSLLGPYLDHSNAQYGEINGAFLEYCKNLRVVPVRYHLERRYWLIDTHLAANSEEINHPDELAEEIEEGARAKVWVNKFERNRQARNVCIEHYKAKCSVCDFDFKEFYGDLGIGYIHVHHIVPISSIGKKYVVDPIKDLRPVCPNCHAMLHKGDQVSSIEELRRLIFETRSYRGK